MAMRYATMLYVRLIKSASVNLLNSLFKCSANKEMQFCFELLGVISKMLWTLYTSNIISDNIWVDTEDSMKKKMAVKLNTNQ